MLVIYVMIILMLVLTFCKQYRFQCLSQQIKIDNLIHEINPFSPRRKHLHREENIKSAATIVLVAVKMFPPRRKYFRHGENQFSLRWKYFRHGGIIFTAT